MSGEDGGSEPPSPHAHGVDKEHTDDESTMPLSAQLERHARPLLELRPTQLAVGMQQVMAKRDKLQKKVKKPKKLLHFLETHPIPGVLGPGQEFYIVDHHHLASALLLLSVPAAQCVTLADWSHEGVDEFWRHMEKEGYVWRHDARGAPLDLAAFRAALPKTVAELADDPYRSLAALVRRAGGYSKVYVPFSEFKWANWLRHRLPGITTDVATSALSMTANPRGGASAEPHHDASSPHSRLCHSSSAPAAAASAAGASTAGAAAGAGNVVTPVAEHQAPPPAEEGACAAALPAGQCRDQAADGAGGASNRGGDGAAPEGAGPMRRQLLEAGAPAAGSAQVPVVAGRPDGSPLLLVGSATRFSGESSHAVAVALAMQLAQSADAADLPGYLGAAPAPLA